MVSVVVHTAVLGCFAFTQWPQPELLVTDTPVCVRFAPPPPPHLVTLPPQPPSMPARKATFRPPAMPRVSSRPAVVATPALPVIACTARASLFQWRLPLSVGETGVVGATAATGDGEVPGVPGASTNGVAGADVAVAATTPTYAQTPLPAYPPLARARGWEGTTLLRVEVLENGNVGHIELLRSSGHASLDHSAVEAVKSWRFNPGRYGDAPTACFIDVPVRFALDKAGA